MKGTCNRCGHLTEMVTFEEGFAQHEVSVIESSCTNAECGRVALMVDGEMRAVGRFLREWCGAARRPAAAH